MQEAFKEYPRDIQVVMCRFLCAIFLHIYMVDEIKQGLSFMKYAMNHPWKFRSWKMGYFVGFLQASVIILVETVNLAVLLTNNTILDIIMNFLALVIISEFDDYFFMTVRNEPIGKLISSGEVNVGEKERKLDEILEI